MPVSTPSPATPSPTARRPASHPYPAGILLGLLAAVSPVALPELRAQASLTDLAPVEAREDFAAGIVALHDFWYPEAARRFRAVQDRAPRFTLGYWGEAMALHRNPFGFAEPPVEEMRAVLQRLAPDPRARADLAATAHERSYLEAFEVLIAEEGTPAERHPAYVDAMAGLAERYPDDIEARAFHARAILLDAPTFGLAPDVRARTAGEAAEVLHRDPDHHGGLHYFIHGMDSPETAPDAFEQAVRYQDLAEGASHAVHMPSHIFMQLGDWDRVIAGNEAAIRESEEEIERTSGTRQSLDRHAMDFLVYALLQQGRESEVRELLDRTRQDLEEFGTGTLRWYDALWSARYALEVGTRSDVPLPRSGYGSAGETLALGLHALVAGRTSGADSLLAEARDRAISADSPAWQIVALQLEAARAGLPEAETLLREAIALQPQMGRPNETPVLMKPPEEQLGDLLREAGRHPEAIAAYRAGQARWPSRLHTLTGLARSHVALADTTAARSVYGALAIQLRQAENDHPVRVEALGWLEATGGVDVEVALELAAGRAPGTLGEVAKRGTGPRAMVIIPCMSCRWRSFDTFMERNADRYTMYAVTLPGFGGSAYPDLPLNGRHPVWFENAVDAVTALLEDEDLRDVVLVGHSYGSVVGLGVAAANPDRITAFVNIDGGLFSDRSWFHDSHPDRVAQARGIWESNLTGFTDPDRWMAFNRSIRPDAARRALYHGMFMATPPEILLQYWKDNALRDVNPLLAGLEMPILDLETIPSAPPAADSARAVYMQQREANGAPAHMHTVFLPGTSHYVMEHRPEVVDDLIAEFLGGGRPADFDPMPQGTRSNADIALRWVSSYRGALRDHYDDEAARQLLDLHAPDVTWVVPSSDHQSTGRDAILGLPLFPDGTLRNVRVDLRGLVEAGADIVLNLGVYFERDTGDETWKPVRRQHAIVLRIEDGLITRGTEYSSLRYRSAFSNR